MAERKGGASSDPYDAPIIIKKIKKGHAAHHGGAWKVAYADFVTAMMSLFIVLWIVGQNNKTKEAIASYFRDPGVFETTNVINLIDKIPEATIVDTAAQGKGGQDAQQESLGEFLRQQWQAQENILKQIETNLHTAIAFTPELAVLKEQIAIELTEEGLRIELLEKEKSSFFEVGSAQLKSSAMAILHAVSGELRLLPNAVVIEGHTDSRPYTSRSLYSNWELSTERANSTRRVMEKAGLREDQIVQIRGYADKQLRYPEQPYDVRNRRISVTILRETPQATQQQKSLAFGLQELLKK
jgi:chemotaxis protein MotB